MTAKDIKALVAVNMDAVREEGELLGLLGMITKDGQTDYMVTRSGAEMVIKALTNYIDVCDGRTPSFPSDSHG